MGSYELVVVGAGINGAGIARDAALRGLRTLLVDKGDVASGTTSWSTRLIHGGLRYLEHADIGLVRESLRERERLLRIAPHLVRPLEFFIPIYANDRRGPMTVRAGMLAYDALSFDKSLERHRMLSAEQALQHEPAVEPSGLKGAAVYHDAQVEYPERLAVENALAARSAGAELLLGHAVRGLDVRDGRVAGVEIEGAGTVAAGLTVNVAGPWVDELLAGLPSRPPERLIGPTKGIHLVVDPFPGAPDAALYVEADDGRPYFIVPWNDLYLIGTTDSRYDGDLDRVVADDDEIAYLVDETNRVIPSARLRREDVVFTYAGLRPLPYAPEGEESSVTRGHVVHDHAPEVQGLLSVVGGKLTTYRQLAQEVVDAAVERLRDDEIACRTADEPLPGGAVDDWDAYAEGFAAGAGAAAGLDERSASRLLRVYGRRAEHVLELTGDRPALARVLDPTTGALAAEVVHALEHEAARTLEDVLLRRTMVGLGPTAGLGPDRAAAEVAREHLGWDAARAEAEVAAFREHAKTMRPREALVRGG